MGLGWAVNIIRIISSKLSPSIIKKIEKTTTRRIINFFYELLNSIFPKTNPTLIVENMKKMHKASWDWEENSL